MTRTRKSRIVAVAALLGMASMALAGCGQSAGAESKKNVTLTYWATNQAANIPADEKVLNSRIEQFTKQTGIKIDLEVVGWPDINNRILAATSTGRGPDVLNFGNTNAYLFGSTGALMALGDKELTAIGGKDKYIPSVFATADTDPITSVPLYSQVYGLFYNKKMLKDAGIEPPTTWQEFLAALEATTDEAKGVYGLSFPGATISMDMHMMYIFGNQHGGMPFDEKNSPTFATDPMVAGARQLIDLFAKGYVYPSSAQYVNGGDSTNDFLQGKVAFLIQQSGVVGSLTKGGMTPDDYGVVPLPVLDPLPAGGEPISSFIAGTNIAIFESTKHKDAALEFVKFMTSPEQLAYFDKEYQVLPVLADASTDFTADPDAAATFLDILSNKSKPLPVEADNNGFQTNAGGAVSQLIGKAVNGEAVSDDAIRAALQDAQSKMAVKK